MKFTKTSVSTLKLPKGKSEQFFWDDDLPGFGVRMRGDRASWVVQYRVGAQQRRESLGDVRKIALDVARKAAEKRFAAVALDRDPGAEKAKAKADLKGRLSFGEVVEDYIKWKEGNVRPATIGMIKYDLLRMSKPLHKRAINSIKLIDIADLIKDVVQSAGKRSRTRHIQGEARAGRVLGERVRGHLSGFFRWAMGEGKAESNPVIGSNNPGEGLGHRNRVLTDLELSAVWHAAGDGEAGKIVKLLILNGCRRCEISALEWHEVDLDEGTITLQDERTKNGQMLKLGLAPMSLDILRSVEDRNDGRRWVFGDTGKPFTNWSYTITALHNRIAQNGYILNRWTLHDLRRTMRTGMGKLGVPPHIAERVINHVQPGIIQVYDQYDYVKEIAWALARWEEYVREVVIPKAANGSPKKVESGRPLLLARPEAGLASS